MFGNVTALEESHVTGKYMLKSELRGGTEDVGDEVPDVGRERLHSLHVPAVSVESSQGYLAHKTTTPP